MGAAIDGLERFAAGQGLVLRPARPDDLSSLLRLHLQCFEPPPERRINGYELYRILRFGRPALLEGPHGPVGYDLAVGYASDPPVSGSAGLTVHPDWRGRGLATALLRYSLIRDLEAGFRWRCGVVSPRNLGSLVILLNHLGFVCDGFHPRFADWGESRFTHRCEITRDVLRRRATDRDALASLLDAGEAGKDYLLLAPDDDAAIARAYAPGPFRVAAVVPGDLVSGGGGDPRLLALPEAGPGALAGGRSGRR
ncbi:MAG: N-acetyltransferase family protein [Acidobacteriota bacterium]